MQSVIQIVIPTFLEKKGLKEQKQIQHLQVRRYWRIVTLPKKHIPDLYP